MALALSEGRITIDQMRAHLKADAERPIDLDMLDAFCDAYERRVCAYGAMLQTIIDLAADPREPDVRRRRESEVDEHVARMMDKLPLWQEQIRTVFAFLTELRASAGQGPVRLCEVSHSTGHLLAAHVMDLAAQGWRGCQEIARRSRTDPRYAYATSAAALFFKAHLPNLPKPNDLLGLLHLERAAAARALRDGSRPRPADGARDVSIRAETVSVTGQSVNVAGEQIATNIAKPGSRPSKGRLKREVAEPLIGQHLSQRPHDTAAQVAEAVGCSVGVVAESTAWKLNQRRLELARQQGCDPQAIRLDEKTVSAAGGSQRRQLHDHRQRAEDLVDALDAREQELFRRIGEYQGEHPNATPEEVASALGCTAGDVERRQAVLNQLVSEQADDQREDVDVDDPHTKRGARRKWVRRRP